MILNIKSKSHSIGYRWTKIRDVIKAEFTEQGCLIARRDDKEDRHFHQKQYKEFYLEEGDTSE